MTKQEIINELSNIVRNSLQAHGRSFKLVTNQIIEVDGKKYNYIYDSSFSELQGEKGKLFLTLQVWERHYDCDKEILAEDLTEEQLTNILESTKAIQTK